MTRKSWLFLGIFFGQLLVLLAVGTMWTAFGWRAALATYIGVVGGQMWATSMARLRTADKS